MRLVLDDSTLVGQLRDRQRLQFYIAAGFRRGLGAGHLSLSAPTTGRPSFVALALGARTRLLHAGDLAGANILVRGSRDGGQESTVAKM